MTAITDFSTSEAQVRLLISDIDDAEQLFGDEAIEAFLALEGGSIYQAAATALITLAVNETLVQKRIEMLDLKTDGPAEADALRALAVEYRKKADAEAPLGIGIEWLDVMTTPVQYAESVHLRGRRP